MESAAARPGVDLYASVFARTSTVNLAHSWSRLSTRCGSTGMHATGHTCTHCGSS